ncbi:MAG: three-Cys-motif partner protein TcmP [Myxococcales bacterium]|nr:three-Cys-motif partner protein TcmP [Myxococcales bacterium]
MATPKETIWELDPHTTAKHEILRRYLGAWFPILGTYHGRILYIDGFSGPGRYQNGEPGSPMIALDVAVNHRKSTSGEIVFWFIEERDDRLAHLKQELAALHLPAHFKVRAEAGRFDEKFGNVLASIEADKNTLAPTFAFIDPFGFSGIPFSLIQRLLGHKRCEAFITFMVDAINRFLEHPEDKVVQHIAEAFGGDEAVQIAKGPGDRIVKLRELYQRKLSSVAKYVRYFEMRDRQDRTQYYLFFATNNELGHLKMKEAMWKMDPDGDFRFSDATNPGQLVLFEADPTKVLASQVREEFRGKGTVTGFQVRTFVENRTAYLKKHMTGVLKQEEESGQLKVDELKTDGKKRRANTFPDEARLTWV